MKVVLDTNILVAALKSQRGASNKLLSLIPSDLFSLVISVPLVMEYEDVLHRVALPAPIARRDIGGLIDYLCQVSLRQDIFFLWRPFLPDPSDDLVLEIAVAGGCDAIVTCNQRHFRGIEKFALRLLTPKDLLIETGALP